MGDEDLLQGLENLNFSSFNTDDNPTPTNQIPIRRTSRRRSEATNSATMHDSLSPPSYEDVIKELSAESASNINISSEKDLNSIEGQLYPMGELIEISNHPFYNTFRNQRKKIQSDSNQTVYFDNIRSKSTRVETKDILLVKSTIDELIKYAGEVAVFSQICTTENCRVVEKYPFIFSKFRYSKDSHSFIELTPAVEFCGSNVQRECVSECSKIHICLKYIKNGICKNETKCQNSHTIKTFQNQNVLSQFCLEDLNENSLKSILRKMLRRATIPKLCKFYNDNFCEYSLNCFDLHICANYVKNLGNCTNGPLCDLNHDIFDTQCINFLNCIGIIAQKENTHDILQLLSKYIPENNPESLFPCEKKQPEATLYPKEIFEQTYEAEDVNPVTHPETANEHKPMQERQSLPPVTTRHKRTRRGQNTIIKSISASNVEVVIKPKLSRREVKELKRDYRIQKEISRTERKIEKMKAKVDYLRSKSIQEE